MGYFSDKMKAGDHFQVVHASVSGDDWRSPLLNTALRLSAIMGVIWLAAFLISTPPMRTKPETAIIGLTIATVCYAAMRPRGAEKLRLAALLMLYTIPVSISYMLAPPNAGTGGLLALAVLMATLYLGRRAGLAAVSIVFVLYIGFGIAWDRHFFPLRPSIELAPTNAIAHWVRVGIGQILGTAAVVAVALYVVEHSRRALRELHRSEQFLRTIIAATNDGVWDWDMTTGSVIWSNRVYEILRAKPDSIGMTFEGVKALVHPDDLTGFIAQLDAHRMSQLPFDFEVRLRRGDGSYGFFRSRGRTIHRDDGTPVRMVGTVSDETERRTMTEALKSNAALLRQFVQHTPAAVAMFDTQMRYIQVSSRWIKDYRLEHVELAGRSHYEILPDTPERWKEIHQRVLAGAVERNEDDSFQRADGQTEWVQWECQPWRQPDGAIGGIIMFTQSMNDRKRAEKKIQEQLVELQRWQRVTLGREQRFQQLKGEVNELCQRLDEVPRYPVQASIEQSTTQALSQLPVPPPPNGRSRP